MIDFKEKARITRESDSTLETILMKRYDNFEQWEEVSKLTDLDIAKLIIKRLLSKLN